MEQKKKNLPEVTLGQYKGLAVTRHVRPVTDKTVDIEVLHQTRMHAVYHPTTAPAKRGFRALLDFVPIVRFWPWAHSGVWRTGPGTRKARWKSGNPPSRR